MDYKNEEKILLILDLDETLVYATKTELNRKSDFKVFDYHVYLRPHLQEFIREVSKDFLLAIWSSASDTYVAETVKRIIPQEINLEFVWGRSRCSYLLNVQTDEYGYYDDDIRNHYNYIKPLKKVKRRGYKLEKIIIVDDTPHKSQANFGNAIYPKEFTGDTADNELLLLSAYLKTLKNTENVRRIEKRNWQEEVG